MSAEFVTQDVVSLKQETTLLQQTFSDMLCYAKQIVVKDDHSLHNASAVWRKARDWKKQIEMQRKAATEPYRKQINLINDKAKEICEPLLVIEQIIEKKNLDYQKLLVTKKQEEDELLREAAALFDVTDLYVEDNQKKLKTEDVTTYTVIKKKFLVKDISQVPIQYLKINEECVENALKLGINEIPGLEIYTEETTKMRSR